MVSSKSRNASTRAIQGLWTLALTTFIIAALYFGREILTPLALAALLTFLISPLVSRIQRYVGRIAAVLVVVSMMLLVTVTVGWVLARQVVDLGTQLPNYKENIRTKLQAFQLPSGGAFSKLSDAFDDLKKDLPGGAAPLKEDSREGIQNLEPRADGQAIPVEVVSSPSASPLELFRMIVSPLLGPLGTAALVLLLMIFMLLQREDLRNRLIRLIGQGHISSTTSAIDDAASRVSRYLLMQLVVNVTYGMGVVIGLWLIGVPNAILWGTFAAVLRFVPYVGPWIAAAFPIILSIAVSPDWWMPLKAVALFVVLELLSNNVMEPWLYGTSTGVSSIALIVAAVFWTYIWGPVGLVMATPITVCIAVMGRHIPQLSFLNVILSDEEALTPAEDCYYRLLRAGGQDELELAESYLKSHSLTDFYDTMLVPALTYAGRDRESGLLDKDQIDQVEFAMGELMVELDERTPAIVKIPEPLPESLGLAIGPCHVLCVPARANRDRLASDMLAQLLRIHHFKVTRAPIQLTTSEKLQLAEGDDIDLVIISVVEPTTAGQARYLCMKYRAAFPGIKIGIGLWGRTEIKPEEDQTLKEAGADFVIKNISDAHQIVMRLSSTLEHEMKAAPVPRTDAARIAALQKSGLLGTDRDFQPTVERLTRVFEAPIAVLSLVDEKFQHFKAHSGLPEALAASGKSPRETSICGHVVAMDEMIVVEDLARDKRFARNPVIREHGFRFYAGAPIHSPDGHAIGSLCLLDQRPREFSDRDERLLKEYAADVSNEIARS